MGADKQIVEVLDQYPHLQQWQIELAKISMLPKALRPSRFQTMGKYNISQDQYYNWLKHPAVLKLKRIMTKRYFQNDIPDILQALRDEALSGNERAARTFLEYVDDWHAEADNQPPMQNIIKIDEVKIMLNEFRNKKI